MSVSSPDPPNPTELTVPSASDIEAAAARIAPYAHRTPLLTCGAIDAAAGAQLYFKCENFQKVGAFKFRGACNAVFALAEDVAGRGVATHSSGNHAQALALAARLRGIAATIVMPDNAPEVKRAAVADYGAQIVSCRPTLAAREEQLAAVVARTGAHFVHPYDDSAVIAGQATAAAELIDQAPPLDAILTPVGGGGLLSGTALAAAAWSPATTIYAAEPIGADDARRSLASGRIEPSVDPRTICDGLLTSLGSRTFPIIRRSVRAIVPVTDPAVVRAMRMIFERMKIVVEPSAAIALAALLESRDLVQGRRIGVILSGGNVDLSRLPWQPC
jgi:threonine dehydratase